MWSLNYWCGHGCGLAPETRVKVHIRPAVCDTSLNVKSFLTHGITAPLRVTEMNKAELYSNEKKQLMARRCAGLWLLSFQNASAGSHSFTFSAHAHHSNFIKLMQNKSLENDITKESKSGRDELMNRWIDTGPQIHTHNRWRWVFLSTSVNDRYEVWYMILCSQVKCINVKSDVKCVIQYISLSLSFCSCQNSSLQFPRRTCFRHGHSTESVLLSVTETLNPL